MKQILVFRHLILRNIQLPIIAHNRIKHYLVSLHSKNGVHANTRSARTPEEAPRLRSRRQLELAGDAADGLQGVGAGHVARQQHVEAREVRVAQAGVEELELGGGGFGAGDLAVGGVVAWGGGVRDGYDGDECEDSTV